MKMYYQSDRNVLHIDRGSKTIMLTLPEEMEKIEKNRFMQSQTLYDIVNQLTREDR